MTTKRELLESLVRLHDRCGEPCSPARLADALGGDPAGVRERLESLRSYELVKPAPGGGGYVPTVTGRELLELDTDDDAFVIVEVPEEGDGG